MKNQTKNLLLLIIITGFVLRLLGLINIELGGDFEYHWGVAGKITRAEEYPLLGPGASINPNFHLGPFYYYLLAVPYFIGGGNYKFAIIFFSLLSSLSIYLLFKLCQSWFNHLQALKVIAFYATSSYMITVGNFPWNAYLVPVFVIIILYLLELIKKGKQNYLVPLGVVFALALQSHLTALFLAPFILFQIPFKKIKHRAILISVMLFLTTLSPWFIYELQHDFIQTKQLALTMFSRSSEACDFVNWLGNHGHGERCFHYIRNTLFAFRLFSQSIFANINIAVVLFTAILSVFTLFTTRHIKRHLFVTWFSTVLFLYLFYSSNIYLHYMLILIPLPFFVLVLFLEKIEKLKRGVIIGNIIFILLIVNNLLYYIMSLGIARS